MPTYEYECDTCGRRFELFQTISAEPLSACPSCHGPVKRLISGGAGIIYKGNGFHSNDYKIQNVMDNKTRCGKNETCCGKSTPCDKPPCDK